VAGVRAVHEAVVERSAAISQLQRDIDDRTQAARAELAPVSDETKQTIDRFDFERRGVESVTQRLADLRASVADCEGRFKGLSDSTRVMAELRTETKSLTEQ